MGEDYDIIQINKDKSVYEVLKDVIDQSLEHHGSIGQAKRHDQIFKMTKGC